MFAFVRRIVFIFLLFPCLVKSQTIGGTAVYNFLNLPPSPLLSATGGVNVSLRAKDPGFSVINPALIDTSMDKQLSVNFNAFFAGSKAYQLATVFHHAKSNTDFGGSLVFLDYGNIPQTDAAGNENGSFRPRDFILQVSAARSYLEKWRYGANLKFISSSYHSYSSSALAIDFGILFSDTSKFFTAGLTARNMGFQLKAYDVTREDLPFDLTIGLTKRLAKAPLGFSVTAQQLHKFNTVYNDTIFNNENGFPQRSSFSSKLISHFIFSAHIYTGNNLEFHLGYNFLRRRELNLGGSGNGMNGFSAGLKAKFSKFQFQYARAYYQRNSAYNQFGINLDLSKLFGIRSL
jgi:hypothetical protein